MPKVRCKAYQRGDQFTVSIHKKSSKELLELINSFNSISPSVINILEAKAQLIYGSLDNIKIYSDTFNRRKKRKKIYKIGDKFTVEIPRDASEELLKLINSKKFLSPSVIEILEEDVEKKYQDNQMKKITNINK